MANPKTILRDNELDKYYVKSDCIEVFPCAYRKASIDPEARLNSEKNISTTAGLGGGNREYVLLLEEQDIDEENNIINNLVIILGGYKFKLHDIVLDEFTAIGSTIYAAIKLDDLILTTNNHKSKKLASWYEGPTTESDEIPGNEELDIEIAYEGELTANYFTGLVLYTNNSSISEESTSSIKLVDDNKFIKSNQLPLSITNGEATIGGMVLNSIKDKLNVGEEANSALGDYSLASGLNTKALSKASHAEGYGTIAGNEDNLENSKYAHAEGFETIALGFQSHAEGSEAIALGPTTHAEGGGTKAYGDISHAEGLCTTAIGEKSHIEGAGSILYEIITFGERIGTNTNPYTYNYTNEELSEAIKINSILLTTIEETDYYLQITAIDTENSQISFISKWPNNELPISEEVTLSSAALVTGITLGETSHAEGYGTITSGNAAHAEGYNTISSGIYGSHAEGFKTTASGSYGSHAEGDGTTASGTDSHAEGFKTTASGDMSHAEGNNTTASNDMAHAEGRNTTASGKASHAEGYGTIATADYQHVFGMFNKKDPSSLSIKHVEIVGNGRDIDHPSNARTLDWKGNEVLAGQLIVGSTGVTASEKLYIYGDGKVKDAFTANSLNATDTLFVGGISTLTGTVTIVDNHMPLLDSYQSDYSASLTVGGGIYIKGNPDAGDARFLILADKFKVTKGGNVTAQTYTALSDACLKENISIYSPEKSILDLPIYKYDFINSKKDNIGCLAQDLQAICPEIVHKTADGFLSIEENKLVYLLIDEVKKLKKEIKELKK